MEITILVIFGVLAVFSAFGVVLMPNAIYSALMLLLNLFSLATLFLLLHAQFMFAAQLLVYAGAILVLFLFVVTLLNPEGENIFRDKKRLQRAGALTGGLLLLIILAGGLIYAFTGGPQFDFAGDKPGAYSYGSVEAFGVSLFTQFLLPFELTALVLLVALLGALVLGKRR
jgi:NADH-quinone oxidoreductase subunit J